MLTACEVVEGSDDAREVKRLLETAFPAFEQMPFENMAALARRDEVSLLAYRDDGQFCGFTFLVEGERMVYVLYLAVDERVRSKGYGGRILADLTERSGGKTLTLDIEPVDDAADNADQRRMRRGFYLRNGFAATGWAVCFEGDVFEVLAKGPDFEPEPFCDLANELPRGDPKTVELLESLISPLTGEHYRLP